MMTPDDIAIRVRRVLWEEWDPINVRRLNAPADEYDSYVTALVRLLKSGASASDLAKRLVEIEDKEMGLRPDRLRAERAAAILAALVRAA